ncbi:hypothetical protein FB451DRAFT_324472 [Mycena latifolia]|nr:hypothetical protein FB451DRAFT_324472 [Mycena latifolia]
MAAPTQALPPWLSFTTVTLPQTTETSLVYLPLTYFGPSIPLGTLWTYGGLSSPAPTSSVASTSTTSTPISSRSSITSTTPSTTASSATPSATPSAPSTSAIVSSTSASAPSSSASASASTVPTAATSSSGLTRGQLIGIVIGSILGAIVLFLFLLCCGIRFRERRKQQAAAAGEEALGTTEPKSRTKFTALFPRRHRRRTRTRFTMVTPPVGGGEDELDDDWQVVASPTSPSSPPGGRETEPGRGATEADPFLTRARLPNPHPGGSSGSPQSNPANNAGTNSNSASSRGTTSSGTNASGYGVLLAHPSLSMPALAPDGNPFDATQPQTLQNLPPGAGPPVPGRRILSPSQMAILVEEDDNVLPRASEDDGSHLSGEGEEAEVVVARRVAVSQASAGPSMAGASSGKEKRRSWIPRFSWLSHSARNSRDIEEEGGLLLFDAGRHSPSGSVSSPGPLSPLDSPPRLVPPAAATTSGNGHGEMREFGARPLLPFLSLSRPVSGVGGSRPISGVSGMSSDGTNGSGKSGGTVFTDARETLSTQGSRAPLHTPETGEGDDVLAGAGAAEGGPQGTADPLDVPAPAPLAAFASSSQHSLHHTRTASSSLHQSSAASLSNLQTTLAGSTTSKSNTTLAGGTPATGHAPLKPERVYAYPHGPPGLGFDYPHGQAPGPGQGWDAAGLELGFSRPASHSKLGTFGSANVGPVPPMPTPIPSFGAAVPGIRVVGASASSGSFLGGVSAPFALPVVGGRSSAPHLSLDLDDAPPGAEGEWRLLGRSTHSLLGSDGSLTGSGSHEWGVGVGDAGEAGRRGTFGGTAAQYHHTQGPSSEQGSFHSRLNSSLNSSSLSSSSAHSRLHSQNPSSGASHSLYPSSGSTGSGSARARALAHAGSVEGPMSPAVSAFGHRAREAGDNSGSSGSGGGRRQENSSGSGAGSPLALARSRSPASPLLSPWAGGLDSDWRPT